MTRIFILFGLIAGLIYTTGQPAIANSNTCNNAGVFAYSKKNGELKVLLGLESYQQWADFVGGRNHNGESCRDIAAREFTEETRGAYSSINTVQQLKNAKIITVKKTKIFLMEVPFIDARVLGNMPEIANFEKQQYCWISWSHLRNSPNKVPSYCGNAETSLVIRQVVAKNLVPQSELYKVMETLN